MPWEKSDEITRELAAMELRADDLSPVMNQVAEITREAIKDNFANEWDGSHAWVPLSPSTVKDRIAKGYGGEHPMLQRTTELMSTIDVVPGRWVTTITAHAPYAGYQQDGTDKIPARPFIALSDRDEDRILELLADHIEGKL